MCRNVPYSTEPCLPAKVGSKAAMCRVVLDPAPLPPPVREGSSATMCTMAPNPSYPQGRAPTLPRVLLFAMGHVP
jgi:hypothetical protein